MSEDEKRRLDALEERTAYILARQDEQEARLQHLMSRLVYVETCQYRLMHQLGIAPESLDSVEAALNDARLINAKNWIDTRLN